MRKQSYRSRRAGCRGGQGLGVRGRRYRAQGPAADRPKRADLGRHRRDRLRGYTQVLDEPRCTVRDAGSARATACAGGSGGDVLGRRTGEMAGKVLLARPTPCQMEDGLRTHYRRSTCPPRVCSRRTGRHIGRCRRPKSVDASDSRHTMEHFVIQASASAVLINLVHWAWTRRGGFMPEPSGLLGKALKTWMAFAVILAVPAYLGLLPHRTWQMFFFGWMTVASLFAICARQVGSPSKATGADSLSK